MMEDLDMHGFADYDIELSDEDLLDEIGRTEKGDTPTRSRYTF
jgi:hypothetical protein